MGRYVGPSCRVCRREGMKLFLKGAKCETAKCPLERSQPSVAQARDDQHKGRLSDRILSAHGKPEELKRFEAVLIDVLQSDATYEGKQYACRELSIIGTELSVPVLGGMLTDPEYSDMARYALERIPGEAVNTALLAALPKAGARARVGIINSLGERCCKGATAEVAKCAESSDKVLCGAAISTLGKIGGTDAVKALDKVRDGLPDNLKTVVYDAYLKIAEKMVAEGSKAEAMRIYSALDRQSVPELVRAAAARGIATGQRGQDRVATA